MIRYIPPEIIIPKAKSTKSVTSYRSYRSNATKASQAPSAKQSGGGLRSSSAKKKGLAWKLENDIDIDKIINE